MELDREDFCPLIRQKCRKLNCNFFIKLRGRDSQGKEIDEWGCTFAWFPILTLETAKEMRQGAAAVESLRNELVKRLAPRSTRGLIEAQVWKDGKSTTER